MKSILIYVWILKIYINAVKRLATLDINTNLDEIKIGKHDANLSSPNHSNITVKPNIKIARVVDKDIRIWQNKHASEKCTYCHVTNYLKKPILVMLFIQQFNDFYSVLRFRYFHGTWVPVTKSVYNEISKSIANFQGLEYDLEVDLNERFNPRMLTIHATSFDQYCSYKLTPAVGYHIDRVVFAKTKLWERSQYQEEVIEIVLLVDDGRFEYMSIMYETYYETADMLYFKYNHKWEKIPRHEFFNKEDPPKTLKPYVFPSIANALQNQSKKGGQFQTTEASDSEEDGDSPDVQITGVFPGVRPMIERIPEEIEPQTRAGIVDLTISANDDQQPSTSRVVPRPETGAVPKTIDPSRLKETSGSQIVRPWEKTPPTRKSGFRIHSKRSSQAASQGARTSGSGATKAQWKGLVPPTFCYPSQVKSDMSKAKTSSGDTASTSKDSSGSGDASKHGKSEKLSTSAENESPTTSFSFRQTRSRGSLFKPTPVYLCDHSEPTQAAKEKEAPPPPPKPAGVLPEPEKVTSVYPELSAYNPDLTSVPDHYMNILDRDEFQLEEDLHHFEEYINDFDEAECTNKRHKRRKGDGDLFVEQEINTRDINGVTLNLHELDDSHPYYTIERQSYYGVPVFKVTPVGDIHFNCVKAGDKIAWTNHNSGCCQVVKAVIMNGCFTAIELIVRKVSNLSYLHYKYEKGYYTSVHTPTYMNYVTSYAVELYEEAKKKIQDEQTTKSLKAEREKITKAILKEQEELSREAYRQSRAGEQNEQEVGIEPFSLTARRTVRVRKRKKPAETKKTKEGGT